MKGFKKIFNAKYFSYREKASLRKQKLLANKFSNDNISKEASIKSSIEEMLKSIDNPIGKSELQKLLELTECHKINQIKDKEKKFIEEIKKKSLLKTYTEEEYKEMLETSIADLKIKAKNLNFEYIDFSYKKRMQLKRISDHNSSQKDFNLNIYFYPTTCSAPKFEESIRKKKLSKLLNIPDLSKENDDPFENKITYTSLFIIIDRKDDKGSLFFSGIIENFELKIENYFVCKNSKDCLTYMKNFSKTEVHRDNTAIDFLTFNSVLQNNFISFIDECGFTQEVLELLVEFSKQKDLNLMSKWYNNIENLLF